jgi:hypothetical protein
MSRMRTVGLLAAGLAFVAAGSGAEAQYLANPGYCQSLQAQYTDALQRASDAGMSGRQMGQIDRLTQQLAQAQGAARRFGCTGGFLFFGPRPAPMCPAIMADVNRLSRQLSQLRGNSGFFSFFGSSPEADVARLRDALARNGCTVPVAGGRRTLCVRLCDGYYFPIEFNAPSSHINADAAACQSMYAQDGQAELFIQSNSDDPANAVSLSGQRYADQPYAFRYRQSYEPSCVAELQDGLSALAQRYYSRFPPSPQAAAAPVSPLPTPQPRRSGSEDPETLANAAGHFTVKPVAPAVTLSDARPTQIRMVGPPYFSDSFDLSKERKKQDALRKTFSLVEPAAAAEAPAVAPAAD